jgi:predicted exporter
MPEWLGADGRTAFLIAEVVAPAFDIGGQAKAVALVRSTAAQVGAAPVTLNGVGVYGVELQRTIKSEARFRSILATLAIIFVLLVAYRNVRITLLAVVPIALGALAGLASLTLLFDQVHGITLAFGFTLVGVAVDYPLHFFSHCRNRDPQDAIRAVWPTLRLGAVSTIIAYLSMSISGSQGLAQLGILSSVGILVAMYATRTLLPLLMAPNQTTATNIPAADPGEIRPRLRHSVWIVVCVISTTVIVWQGSIWSNDLSSMTPIDPAKLRQDNALRVALGAPDIRYLVTVRAPTEQQALEATEALAKYLDHVRTDGLLEDFRVVTKLLPSQLTQRERQAALGSITDPTAMIRQAVDGTPFRADVFAPFVAALTETAKQTPLTAKDFAGTALSNYLEAHLYFDGNEWVSLATLFNLAEPSGLATRLVENYPQASLVDLKAASSKLVLNYRQRIHLVLFGALILIVVLLVVRVGFSTRLIWICGTLSAAVLATIAINAMLITQLSIFNLIALVLIAGLGLDYALFISRAETNSLQAEQTRHAVLVCVTSTLLAFLILAFSSVPILASLGTTIATGVFVNYALTKTGAKIA